MATSYKESGVDIDKGNELVKNISPLTKATNRLGANTDLGGFGGLFDLAKCKFRDPILVSATDGVGTKLKLAFAANKHDTIGIDLVAMCVNDLVVQGAEPLFFLDYFATGKLENDVAYDVIKGISEGCKQSGCALIGGETAEMPGMYQKGHYDLAGFAVGAVERDEILPKKDEIRKSDLIIGLPSSGLHSNGFSLVRHILEENAIAYSDKSPVNSNETIMETLLTPTKIYVKTCLELAKKTKIKAFAHITGGGLTENIPRILPDNLGAEIRLSMWELPELFSWLQNLGKIEREELFKTFNCGIGMVIIASESEYDKIKEVAGDAVAIGSIVKYGDSSVMIRD